MLDRLPDGDILLYCDAGCEFPSPELVHDFIDAIGQADVFAMQMGHVTRLWTKGDTLQAFGIDLDHSWATEGQYMATVHVWRVNDRSRALARKWLEFACVAHLIDDSPSTMPNPYFKDHRHDQSIFDLVIKQARDAGTAQIHTEKDLTYPPTPLQAIRASRRRV